jgi:Thiol-disulfide isomerase and thioredoxins
MIKYILCLLLVISGNLVNAQPKNMVVIKGTLNGDLKGHNKIYMYTRTSNDSAEIRNGAYSFSFPFSEVEIKMLYPAYIKATQQMYQPFGILIAEPGTYYVVSDISKGMNASELKGPESMLLYKQFNNDQSAAYQKMNYALADIYGKDWYLINEKDAGYESLQESSDSLKNIFLVPLIDNLVRRHPDSYATAFVLSGMGRQIGSIEKKEQWLSMISKRMKKSEQVKIFADYIQGLKSSGIGSTVANFVLPDPQGNDVDFKSLKGKYVLIDFWASWCAPCRRSFPHMREVYKTFKSDQFEIYGISIDEDKKAWLKAVEEENNPWVQSLDTKNVSQSGFAVTGVPATFLIDPQGKILVKEVGFDPNGNSAIEKKLTELFGKKVEPKVDAEKKNQPASKAIPMSTMGRN